MLEKIKISTAKPLPWCKCPGTEGCAVASGSLWRAFCVNRLIDSNVPKNAMRAADVCVWEKLFLA